MIVKEPVMKNRVRKIPGSFSWIDHRLVRQRYIESCTHEQSALYLFLVCVADARGLSYYSDKSIIRQLNMDMETLWQALVRFDKKQPDRMAGADIPGTQPGAPGHPPGLGPDDEPGTSVGRCGRRCPMIDYETYTKIRNYYTQDHLRYSQIAARVGLDQRTVAIWANEKGRGWKTRWGMSKKIC